MSVNSSPPGSLIHQVEDEIGPISVHQNQNLLYLSFGNKTEQSCLTIDQPHRLEHAYTQAMMLSLLMKQDMRSVLILGLGGGSLVRALRHFRQKLKIDAIEYRQAVIDVARQYFALPEDHALNIICDDAGHYIKATAQRYDLIFTDLYLPEGMDQLQLSQQYLEHCKAHLMDDGLVIVNFWSHDFKQTLQRQQALEQVFGKQVLNTQVPGGNTITFAFNDAIPRLNKKDFTAAAQKLGQQLEIPLQNLARGFWQMNAAALQMSRYP